MLNNKRRKTLCVEPRLPAFLTLYNPANRRKEKGETLHFYTFVVVVVVVVSRRHVEVYCPRFSSRKHEAAKLADPTSRVRHAVETQKPGHVKKE